MKAREQLILEFQESATIEEAERPPSLLAEEGETKPASLLAAILTAESSSSEDIAAALEEQKLSKIVKRYDDKKRSSIRDSFSLISCDRERFVNQAELVEDSGWLSILAEYFTWVEDSEEALLAHLDIEAFQGEIVSYKDLLMIALSNYSATRLAEPSLKSGSAATNGHVGCTQLASRHLDLYHSDVSRIAQVLEHITKQSVQELEGVTGPRGDQQKEPADA